MITPEEPSVAKRLLYSPDNERSKTSRGRLQRRALRRRKEEGPTIMAVFCFLVTLLGLLAASLVIPLVVSGKLTSEMVRRPRGLLQVLLTFPDILTPSLLNFKGKPIFGMFGALPVALVCGCVFGILTYLCMFYDSNEPGNFPPSPVSPNSSRKKTPPATPSSFALGYRMVPINSIAIFAMSLILLRLCLNLPLY